MNLVSSPSPTILLTTLNPKPSSFPSSFPSSSNFPFSPSSRPPSLHLSCSASSSSNDPPKPPKKPTPKPKRPPPKPTPPLEPEPTTRFPDPMGEDDEWGRDSGEEERLVDLKRAFVDTVFGTDSGFGASSELRAEALELVQQLEAKNPTPAPTQATDLLNGNWVLVYTTFSELVPLLAAGRIPSVKVEKICQRIDVKNLTIENSTTLAGPIATFSISALANFEVRSPSRIQVEFKEGSFSPPEIKSTVDLPENISIFGQSISLSPVQQSLNPLQSALANIAGTISSQSPLKIPIPGERTKSWLLITYLDKDLRISRGDGGLFVLVKEGSPLLYQ